MQQQEEQEREEQSAEGEDAREEEDTMAERKEAHGEASTSALREKYTSKAKVQENEATDLPHLEGSQSAKPMAELKAGSNVYFQAYVIKESANEVKIRFPGVNGTHKERHEWLSKGSSRLWRGSMRNSSWRHIGKGAWEPRSTPARKRSRSGGQSRSNAASKQARVQGGKRSARSGSSHGEEDEEDEDEEEDEDDKERQGRSPPDQAETMTPRPSAHHHDEQQQQQQQQQRRRGRQKERPDSSRASEGQGKSRKRAKPAVMRIESESTQSLQGMGEGASGDQQSTRSSPEKHIEHDTGRNNRGDARMRKGSAHRSPLPAQGSLREPTAHAPPSSHLPTHSSSAAASTSALAAWFHAHYSLLAKAETLSLLSGSSIQGNHEIGALPVGFAFDPQARQVVSSRPAPHLPHPPSPSSAPALASKPRSTPPSMTKQAYQAAGAGGICEGKEGGGARAKGAEGGVKKEAGKERQPRLGSTRQAGGKWGTEEDSKAKGSTKEGKKVGSGAENWGSKEREGLQRRGNPQASSDDEPQREGSDMRKEGARQPAQQHKAKDSNTGVGNARAPTEVEASLRSTHAQPRQCPTVMMVAPPPPQGPVSRAAVIVDHADSRPHPPSVPASQASRTVLVSAAAPPAPIPAVTTSQPSHSKAPPAVTTSSPSNAKAPPAVTTSLPSHVNTPPANTTSLPSHANAPPAVTTSLPSHVNTPPANTASLPSHANAQPAVTTSLPSNMNAPPTVRPSLQSHIQAPPAVLASLPSYIGAPPAGSTTHSSQPSSPFARKQNQLQQSEELHPPLHQRQQQQQQQQDQGLQSQEQQPQLSHNLGLNLKEQQHNLGFQMKEQQHRHQQHSGVALTPHKKRKYLVEEAGAPAASKEGRAEGQKGTVGHSDRGVGKACELQQGPHVNMARPGSQGQKEREQMQVQGQEEERRQQQGPLQEIEQQGEQRHVHQQQQIGEQHGGCSFGSGHHQQQPQLDSRRVGSSRHFRSGSRTGDHQQQPQHEGRSFGYGHQQQQTQPEGQHGAFLGQQVEQQHQHQHQQHQQHQRAHQDGKFASRGANDGFVSLDHQHQQHQHKQLQQHTDRKQEVENLPS